jgi:ubiquinone biosynthesis protein Coq4
MEIKGNDAAYLMGKAEPARSSVLTSTSSFLNNPRMRDIYAQMGLKRNGGDVPDAYLVPEVNRAIAEETDVDALRELIAAERARLPEFASWLDARFVSDWTAERVAHCAEGTVGAQIRSFIANSGMEIDFMFRGAPADDLEYMTKRRVQNHDIEHMVTGLDASPVGEIGLIVANCTAIHRYFKPELAGALTFQTMFLASTSLMRMACHYPRVVPAMLEAIARGEALGRKQHTPLFMICWEEWIDVPVSEARARLGFEDGPEPGYWSWTFDAAKG